MHEYDVTLKLILQSFSSQLIQDLTGMPVVHWYNVELPEIRQTRVDLLGETEAGSLVHIELQSSNDGTMALRMLEYALGIYRIYKQFPRQVLLYVGNAPMAMSPALSSDRLSFSYEQVDIRDMDGERFLASGEVGDNLIAILAKLRDHRSAVRKIVRSIARLAPAELQVAWKQLLILAGLRRLEHVVGEEGKKVPILNDIMDHQIIGPAIRQGLRQGREKEALSMVVRLLTKRFGQLPAWAEERLASRSTEQLEDIGVALLDSNNLEELLQD